MRRLGLLLLAVGFLGSALVTVRNTDDAGLQWRTVEWGWYALAFLVGAAGVVLLRMTGTSADARFRKLDVDIATLETSLGRLVGKLQTFNRHREEIDVYDVHAKIDEQLTEDIGIFVEARESLVHRYGLQPYANLMSQFAAGERYINRAWSASADGYIDEVWICIGRAEQQMSTARSLLKQCQQSENAKTLKC